MGLDWKHINPIFRILDDFFQRKTANGFAVEMKLVEDLPCIFRETVISEISKDEIIRKMILIPFQGYINDRLHKKPKKWDLLSWEISPEKVIVLTSSRLLVVSTGYPGSASQILSTPLCNLIYLEIADVLLHSWFGWVWENHGKIEHIQVDYNTVGRFLFEDLSVQIRRMILYQNGDIFSPDHSPVELLEGLPFKFKNMIRFHMLLHGEQIQRVVYRPLVKNKKPAYFGRKYLPRLSLIRTNAHLIITQEDPAFGEDCQGLLTQFYPLPMVQKVSMAENDFGVELHFSLALNGTASEVITQFPANLYQQVDHVIDQWK